MDFGTTCILASLFADNSEPAQSGSYLSVIYIFAWYTNNSDQLLMYMQIQLRPDIIFWFSPYDNACQRVDPVYCVNMQATANVVNQ